MKLFRKIGIFALIAISSQVHAKPLDDKYGPEVADVMRCTYKLLVDEKVEHVVPMVWDDAFADKVGLKDQFALLAAMLKADKTCNTLADAEGDYEYVVTEEFWDDVKADFESE